MAIKGISGNIMSIISNQSDEGALQEFIDAQAATFNTDSPFAAAQLQADMLSKTKQKKPLSFEYAKTASNGVVTWSDPVELYVNPNRISVSTQKIKSKQITRGAIFYNMWGDDHWTLQISGVTGLSGMKGIEQIEEVYHASGTLLRYQNYGPEKVSNSTLSNLGQFQTIDFSDPYSIINGAVNSNSANRLDEIESTMNSELQNLLSPRSYLKFENAIKALGSLKNQFYNAGVAARISAITLSASFITNKQDKYDYVMSQFNASNILKGLDSSIISAFSYEMSRGSDMDETVYVDTPTTRDISDDSASIYEVTKFQTSLNQINASNSATSAANNAASTDSISSKIAYLTVKRAAALTDHLKNLKDYYTREAAIRNNLVNYANDTSNGEFSDLWRPRRIIMYFENRAYIGHFENFSHNRDATSNLISYELRFVVERMLVGQVQ